jgi:heme-degrading monooxygenase HmoA
VISRIWHGWTRTGNAAAYQELLLGEVLPGIGERVPGFLGATVLRRDAGADGVEFVTITRFESLDAVRAFAGDDWEVAVVPPEAQRLLDRFDARSAHYETVLDVSV